MKKRDLITTIVIATFFAMSCGGLSSKQKDGASDAIKALRKLQAATQVGVNYQNYGQLMIEAKAQVNETQAMLPEIELKKEISAAMDAYVDVGQIWGEKIKDHTTLYTKYGLGKDLITKYSLPTKKGGYGADTLGESIESDLAMQLIWAAADKHLEQAGNLLKK